MSVLKQERVSSGLGKAYQYPSLKSIIQVTAEVHDKSSATVLIENY